MSSRARDMLSRTRLTITKALTESVDDSTGLQIVKAVGLNVLGRIERIQEYGFTSVPPANSEALISEVGGSEDSSVVVKVDSSAHRPKDLKDGESCFYSMHGQTVLHNESGETVFNSGTDFMVFFNEMLSAFNQLKSDHDALVTKYNAHIHITTATIGTGGPGVIAPTTTTGTPSTADMSSAKAEKLRI